MPKRSSMRINKSRVDALQPGQQIWDSEVTGFGVVASKHAKSYKLKYRFQGRQRMLTIGTHGSPFTVEMARKQAQIHLGTLRSGSDPAVAKVVSGTTVADLCDIYLKRHAQLKKKDGSVQQDKANIRNHVKPLLGRLLVAAVTRKDVDDFKHNVQAGKTAPADPKAVQKAQRGGAPVTGGKGAANRCLALLSKMFTLAETWEYRPSGSNPVRGVEKFKEKPKERYLSEDEFRAVWAKLDDMDQADNADPYLVAYFRLLILTGARRDEIRTLKWTMVDLERLTIALPDSKTGPKTLHINNEAASVLKSLPRAKDNPFVIAGAKPGQHLVNVQKPWNKIRGACGITDVRLHDLRHTYASMAIQGGHSLYTVGKLLGHSNAATTQRYAHLADRFLHEANQAVGRTMAQTLRRAAQKSGAVDDEAQ